MSQDQRSTAPSAGVDDSNPSSMNDMFALLLGEINKKYLRPANVEFLKTPRVNPLIWGQKSAGTRAGDAKSQKIQHVLIGAVSAIVRSSVRLLLWTQIHAASTRRAISTRHAWICIPNLASLSTFPRGVHAARQKHVPCVERISFLRVPHPPECMYPTQRSRKGPTRFNEARACSVPCVTLGPRVYCPAPTRTRE